MEIQWWVSRMRSTERFWGRGKVLKNRWRNRKLNIKLTVMIIGEADHLIHTFVIKYTDSRNTNKNITPKKHLKNVRISISDKISSDSNAAIPLKECDRSIADISQTYKMIIQWQLFDYILCLYIFYTSHAKSYSPNTARQKWYIRNNSELLQETFAHEIPH